jgi:hypothetical protein
MSERRWYDASENCFSCRDRYPPGHRLSRLKDLGRTRTQTRLRAASPDVFATLLWKPHYAFHGQVLKINRSKAILLVFVDTATGGCSAFDAAPLL